MPRRFETSETTVTTPADLQAAMEEAVARSRPPGGPGGGQSPARAGHEHRPATTRVMSASLAEVLEAEMRHGGAIARGLQTGREVLTLVVLFWVVTMAAALVEDAGRVPLPGVGAVPTPVIALAGAVVLRGILAVCARLDGRR